MIVNRIRYYHFAVLLLTFSELNDLILSFVSFSVSPVDILIDSSSHFTLYLYLNTLKIIATGHLGVPSWDSSSICIIYYNTINETHGSQVEEKGPQFKYYRRMAINLNTLRSMHDPVKWLTPRVHSTRGHLTII